LICRKGLPPVFAELGVGFVWGATGDLSITSQS
jgi:hypothetical protein